jgi:glyoxylase-like metal-dependent hydrolase (beta-lactamase superfamily II)
MMAKHRLISSQIICYFLAPIATFFFIYPSFLLSHSIMAVIILDIQPPFSYFPFLGRQGITAWTFLHKRLEVIMMRVRQPGKVRERLWRLGREESCVYVLEGNKESMIVNGGISYLMPDLLRQFEAFGIDESRITKLLILHAHFDHVGIVPFFKRRHPGLEIYASARAWEILQMPKAINTINGFSRSVARQMGKEEVYTTCDLDWGDEITGTAVSEGDRIDLGDLEVRVYETPGHSSCSISAYVPQLKALFASDGGGIPYKETIIASGNSNFTQYQQSLEKLKDLDVEYACADHYAYITGDEARDFIQHTIKRARQHRAFVEEIYLRTGDIETTAREMVITFCKENPDYMLAPDILEGVYRQMVRHIANAMEDCSRPSDGKGLHVSG